MEHYYLFLVGVLFVVAIADIFVGVSTDAANFLGSAIGARVAPIFVILIIASVGLLIGAVSSEGMMEIARSGIFVPSMFTFHNVMLIFVGIMITDVLLLDTFSSLGMPTSTTVSIVFELIGGGVMMALITLHQNEESYSLIYKYVNTTTVVKIVVGIFSSVIIAFTFGSIIQWFTRLIFTFDYHKKIETYGALFGGVAITAISYFIVIKGIKQASFMTPEVYAYIQNNTAKMLLYSFAFWTVISQLLKWIFKMNVLKIVVLAGTFSVALAFAGNDMVNFLGAPLAGFSSFQIFMEQGGTDDQINMHGLEEAVATSPYILLIGGMIMIISLWTSKRIRKVAQTTINLSSQSSGAEQFGSSLMARLIVRHAIKTSEKLGRFVPVAVKKAVQQRFVQSAVVQKDASFDLLRASINLLVASMLITVGTSLQLPLSTTYVTFMVAMGTSLADGAWGRESAVYRITGVFTVITGWFLTAFIAFTVCAIVVYILYIGKIYAVIGFVVLIIFILFKSHILGKNKKNMLDDTELKAVQAPEDNLEMYSQANIDSILKSTIDVFSLINQGFTNYDHHILKEAKQKSADLDAKAKSLKDNVSYSIKNIGEEFFHAGHNYIQVVDYLREIARSLSFIAEPSYTHVNNNHKPLVDIQKFELFKILNTYEQYITNVLSVIESKDYSELDALVQEQNDLFELIQKIRKKQMKRAKAGEVNTRNSLLYLQILHEAKQILSYTMNVLKSQRDLAIALQ